MHVCMYVSMQVCKYASMQVCKYANKSEAICMSAVAAFFKYEIGNQILDSVKADFIRIYMIVMQTPTPPQNLKLQSDFGF